MKHIHISTKISYIAMALFTIITKTDIDFSGLRFHSTGQTLTDIMTIIFKQEKGVYLRFGDGDLNLALGTDDSFQQADTNLQTEMKEAFTIVGKNVLKALPLHCNELNTLEYGMGEHVHEISYEAVMRFLNTAASLWPEPITDVYSPVALHHTASNHPKECIAFLEYLKAHSCILIGNKNIPSEIRTLLFGDNCIFVPTPDVNAFEEIDRIEKDALLANQQINGYKIIITSMGCSGRILQKRLWHKINDAFFFDFGSLMDALCGWNTRMWIHYSGFNLDAFLALMNPNTRAFSLSEIEKNMFAKLHNTYFDTRSNTLSPYYHMQSGLALLGEGKYIQASKEFKQAINLNCHSPRAQECLQFSRTQMFLQQEQAHQLQEQMHRLQELNTQYEHERRFLIQTHNQMYEYILHLQSLNAQHQQELALYKQRETMMHQPQESQIADAQSNQ